VKSTEAQGELNAVYAKFYALVAVYFRRSVFWDVGQHILVICYGRRGTACRFSLQGKKNSSGHLESRRSERHSVPKLGNKLLHPAFTKIKIVWIFPSNISAPFSAVLRHPLLF